MQEAASIATLLQERAASHGDRVALVTPEGEVSYRSLAAGARRVTASLVGAGIALGDRVALSLPNGRAFVEGWFGTLGAGATVVPLPLGSTPAELRLRLSRARCRALVGQAPLSDDELPDLRRVLSPDPGAAERAPRAAAPEATAMILFTSATTGEPKGVRLSHASLGTHTQVLARHTLALDEGDRVLGALPFSHSFGCRLAMLAPLHAGACIIVLPRFDAARSFEALAAHRVTFAPVVPTMLSAWSRRSGTRPPPSLRFCLSAGAPLPAELRARAAAQLGVPIREGYGLTEASFSCVDAPPEPPTAGTVGRPVPGVTLCLIGVDGHEVGTGEVGEILVRGHNVMTDYLDDPPATRRALVDGWLHSGDLGRLDAAGRLTLVDRKKDVILRGGFNVYPAEVEAVLSRHPGVEAAFVVGRPHPHYGEEVVAVLVACPAARPRPAELAAWVGEALARYKVPRAYAFIDAPPLGPSGKVQKRVLKEQLDHGELSLVFLEGDSG
jgi:long-chain acyl-CoA synthetase